MKVLAVNGSPRKTWNTATLLAKVLEGAESEGARTEMVHLGDLRFSGCVSCFACKLRGGESYGRCAVRDDLRPVLESVGDVDALVLGSSGRPRCCGRIREPGSPGVCNNYEQMDIAEVSMCSRP